MGRFALFGIVGAMPPIRSLGTLAEPLPILLDPYILSQGLL